ncbi:MAG: phage holin family protein [Candidatus Saccharimonadales bacterium]
MSYQIYRFVIRWAVSSLGLWIAATFLSTDITLENKLTDIVIAGLFLAVVNTFLKPILVILSLPAIVVTLGLFMIILNGVLVYIVSKLYHPLHITNF